MIGIIYYGSGNIGSLSRLLNDLNESHKVVCKPEDFFGVNKIILPGVGAFDSAIISLKNSGLYDAIRDKVLVSKLPILGICLGMQLLFNESEEGKELGFGFITGKVKRMTVRDGTKLPHVGWNSITIKQNSVLLSDINDNSYFYFTHSFYCDCSEKSDILCETIYTQNFTSVVGSHNILGVQFHPEKSHKDGIRLLENFIKRFNA